ncbi:MAG TPA: ATP synthase F1 subunit gamma [Ignavibacteriaceae bacterium]|nr:ATP synthase F1 subunit gamma [Ignavibacteriaceae bacterium]
MATLRDIRARIKGVQNTQQITKAMKMVAAAKLRRAQERVVNARPYARKISETLAHLITEEDLKSNPYLSRREAKNTAVVVVTADRGLCGAFNANIIKESIKQLDEYSNTASQVHIFCIGRKAAEFFSKRNSNISAKKIGIFSELKFEDALLITDEITGNFLNGIFDRVILVYNEFKSIIQQKIRVEQFLPFPLDNNSAEEKNIDYIYEPDRQFIFNYLLPKHLRAQIWRILLESNAAELAARMTAMDNATTNAKELIRTLQLKYNKERQAAITKEILEIVSGANALKTE